MCNFAPKSNKFTHRPIFNKFDVYLGLGSVAACLTPRTLLLGCRRPATNCQACHHFHLSVQYSVAPLDGSLLLSIVGAREDLVRLAVGGEDEGDVGLDVGVRVSRR